MKNNMQKIVYNLSEKKLACWDRLWKEEQKIKDKLKAKELERQNKEQKKKDILKQEKI